MTLSDLQQWRKRVPFVVLGLCALPWFLLTSNGLAEVDLPMKIIVPGLALVGTFFYVGLGAREARWKREIDTHVGAQIRTALLAMVPSDLEVTDNEKDELAKSEIYRELTGVFWEAIDRNQVLKSHKEHFYSNGIEYSTTIDVFLICGPAGFCYAAASLVLADTNLAFVAAILLAIALASRLLALPHVRQRHISLSAEQLDLLRREESDFVSNRFRDIVVGWRRARLFR
jgi:hypothetical protein